MKKLDPRQEASPSKEQPPGQQGPPKDETAASDAQAPLIPQYEMPVETKQQLMKYSPFMRGVMRFEDYNYNMYNQFILLDNQVGHKMQNAGYANMSRMGSHFGESEARLTQHNLDQSI